jgi:hypothetical protein
MRFAEQMPSLSLTHGDAWRGKEKQDFGTVLAQIFGRDWFSPDNVSPFIEYGYFNIIL